MTFPEYLGIGFLWACCGDVVGHSKDIPTKSAPAFVIMMLVWPLICARIVFVWFRMKVRHVRRG